MYRLYMIRLDYIYIYISFYFIDTRHTEYTHIYIYICMHVFSSTHTHIHTHIYIYYIYRCAEILFCWYSFIFETHLFISPRATLRNPRGLLIAYAEVFVKPAPCHKWPAGEGLFMVIQWRFNGNIMEISWDISYIYMMYIIINNLIVSIRTSASVCV